MSTASTLPGFNPTQDPQVAYIKQRVEALIIYIEGMQGDPRCKSIAITNLEQGAMWAVKSRFVTPESVEKSRADDPLNKAVHGAP